MVRRYEQTDTDEYEGFHASRPPRRKPPPRDLYGGRYDIDPPSLQVRQEALKAKIIMVCTNGRRDKGFRLSYKRKDFPQYESLLDYVNMKMKQIAVRYLYRWPAAELIRSLDDIEDDDFLFVASDSRRLNKTIAYGGVEYNSTATAGGSSFADKYSRNSHESRGTIGSKPSTISVGSDNSIRHGKGPLNINVRSNTDRTSCQSMFINPQSEQPFEDLLRSVEELVNIDYPPVTALYSSKPPHRKVESYSSFFSVYRSSGDNFIACGQEGPPQETRSRGSRDTSPMRNGYGQTPRQRNGKQSNGSIDPYARQSYDARQLQQSNGSDDEPRDRHGRGRNQPDGEDHSPSRAPPRDRRQSHQKQPQQQQHPGNRQQGKQQTPRGGNDDSRPPNRGGGRQQKHERQDSPDSGRNSVPEAEMAERIEEMETVKDDADEEIND